MTVLVIGAAGNVGRLVVERLLAAGASVRALTRDPRKAFPPGVEVVTGDLADPSTLGGAFAGVSRMYLFPVPATARVVAGLARQAGVRRAVVLSSGAVTGGHDTDFHLPVERASRSRGWSGPTYGRVSSPSTSCGSGVRRSAPSGSSATPSPRARGSRRTSATSPRSPSPRCSRTATPARRTT
jgi:nucleoside-diphosphate-sugar epimerase